jgi:hypothetical protein
MIQRIQTIFLIAASILQVLFISLPLSHFALTDFNVALFAVGFKETSAAGNILLATTPIYLLCWAILFLSVTSIFLYKKRILQMRFSIYTILLNMGLIGLLFFNISNFLNNNVVEAHSYTPTLALPIVNIILLFLAFRGIRKDELLIKAYDRLR